MLKRTIWKDIYEIIFVGSNQILVKTLNNSQKEISILSEYGGEIQNVKIMGRDNYLVAYTNSTLIIVDLVRILTSEASIHRYFKKMLLLLFYFIFSYFNLKQYHNTIK